MEDFFLTIKELLIIKNFFLVIRGLDNTLLLLIISLPIGFVLSLIFALGRVSKISIISKSN